MWRKENPGIPRDANRTAQLSSSESDVVVFCDDRAREAGRDGALDPALDVALEVPREDRARDALSRASCSRISASVMG